MSDVALYPCHEQQHTDRQQTGALIVEQPGQPRPREVLSQEFPDFLAPELFCKSMDIAESLHFCETHFAYTQQEIALAQISMNDTFMLSVDGQPYRVTQHALSDLCTILGIPFNFAVSIPTALTALNVQGLKSLRTQSVNMIARDNTVVTFLDPMKWAEERCGIRTKKMPHYLPVTNLNLLHMIEKVWSGQDVDTCVFHGFLPPSPRECCHAIHGNVAI